MTFMFIFFSSFILRRMRSDVVPALVMTDLPARSGKSFTPEFTPVSRRVPAMKKVVENAVCCSRDFRCVVTPHSRSTEPFCTSDVRFCEVTGICCTCRLGLPVFCLTASITCEHRSAEKPMILFWLSRYENGIDDSRTPIRMVLLSWIFLSVPSSACACAPTANRLASASGMDRIHRVVKRILPPMVV